MLRLLPEASRPRESSASSDPIPRLAPLAERGPLRVLDFDIENRPLTYRGYDKTTAEITAIAWTWILPWRNNRTGAQVRMKPHCVTLGPDCSVGGMISTFRERYDMADVVTGHFIRRHDLPILNAAMIENGLPPLGAKLTSDTCLDLIRFSELPRSQEYLAEMLGVVAPKEGVSQHQWRAANRLTPEGIAETRRRVVGDVEQHVELRAALIRRGLLGAPRWWNPGGSRVAA